LKTEGKINLFKELNQFFLLISDDIKNNFKIEFLTDSVVIFNFHKDEVSVNQQIKVKNTNFVIKI
jgi:hypothetical protein